MGLPDAGWLLQPWYWSRAAGITSLVFFSLSVAAGLAGSLARRARSPAAGDWYRWHRLMSVIAWGFALMHAAILRYDPTVPFSWKAIAVPFAAPYRPFWTGLGVVAFYGLAGLLVSFDGRAALGQLRAAFERLHRLGPVIYGAALLHGAMAGTDLGRPPVRAWLVFGGVAATALLVLAMRRPEPAQSRGGLARAGAGR